MVVKCLRLWDLQMWAVSGWSKLASLDPVLISISSCLSSEMTCELKCGYEQKRENVWRLKIRRRYDTVLQFLWHDSTLSEFIHFSDSDKIFTLFLQVDFVCARLYVSMINIWFLCVFVSRKREIYETEKFSFQHFLWAPPTAPTWR